MKTHLAFAFLAFSFFSIVSAQATLLPEVVVHTPDVVFAPKGFDDNDNVQIVLSGYFGDTCHKVGPVQTQIDVENKRVVVRNSAYYYTEAWCLFVLVPYTRTIDLGVLPTGDYSVWVENRHGALVEMTSLPVAVSLTNSPDDFMYAPVGDVFLENSDDGSPVLVIRGVFHNPCMVLDEVRTYYTADHMIEVQPIVTLRGRDSCSEDPTASPIPFESRILLKKLSPGKTLIHVRSMNGQSVNKVVDSAASRDTM